MSRSALAALLGGAGFLLYVALVVALADHVLPLHWLAGLLYFAAAGVAWVPPAAWLMRWARRG